MCVCVGLPFDYVQHGMVGLVFKSFLENHQSPMKQKHWAGKNQLLFITDHVRVGTDLITVPAKSMNQAGCQLVK